VLQVLAPEGAGSGIPQVKAALALAPVALNFRVAGAKFAATVLALGSGLALGRQGPIVQIGTALARQLSRWIPTSPEYERQLVAAGAAAGLAAGFNAPIAGVLFVIEDLLRDFSGLTLGTALIASFVGATVSRLFGNQGFSLDARTTEATTHLVFQELPFLLVLGVACGTVASLFQRSVVGVVGGGRRWPLVARGAIAGGLTGLTLAFLADFRDSSGLQQRLAAGDAGIPYALGVLGVRLGLTLLACWAEIPGGLFFPSLVFGAAIGSVVSRLEETWLGLGHPATYALAGMGAFFGAVAKVPMTAIAMVFELTTNFNLVLPLMVSVTTAYLVAEKLAPGSLYEHLLRLSGIDLPTVPQDGIWLQLTAEEVMQPRVEVLAANFTLAETVQAFGRSHHRGFPVVQDGELVGIVTQTDLEQAQQRRERPDVPLSQVMTPNPIVVAPQDTLARVLYLLSHYKLSRLPVVDRRHLVGIITRSDILRAEVERLHVENTPARLGSYLVYQRRSPAAGRGTVLVPVANPETIPVLAQLAAAMARRWGFEVEFCHGVVVAPRDRPTETVVDVEPAIELLEQARMEVLTVGVPAHCQVRIAQSAGGAIADAARDSHANLVVMGWRSQRDETFGQTLEGLVQQSRCDLVLVKFATADPSSLQRWLVPVAGGPNARRALELLPYLSAANSVVSVVVCQVLRPGEESPSEFLEPDIERLREALPQSARGAVTTVALCATDVVAAILDLAQSYRCDALVLGASRESLLSKLVQGNIPEEIARQAECTVFLVCKAF